jgi:hypothetical protein
MRFKYQAHQTGFSKQLTLQHFLFLTAGKRYNLILPFNMHQTMTAKDYQDRGTINRINRQQHPPHRKFRIYQVRERVNVRYHFGGSMELNACILLLALMVYL